MLSYFLLLSAAAGIATMVYAARFVHTIPKRNEDFSVFMLA
ncbi:hypothetical protein [Massilia sp. DD77]